jgi:hypothetical protein
MMPFHDNTLILGINILDRFFLCLHNHFTVIPAQSVPAKAGSGNLNQSYITKTPAGVYLAVSGAGVTMGYSVHDSGCFSSGDHLPAIRTPAVFLPAMLIGGCGGLHSQRWAIFGIRLPEN